MALVGKHDGNALLPVSELIYNPDLLILNFAAIYPAPTYATPQVPPATPDNDIANTNVSAHLSSLATYAAFLVGYPFSFLCCRYLLVAWTLMSQRKN